MDMAKPMSTILWNGSTIYTKSIPNQQDFIAVINSLFDCKQYKEICLVGGYLITSLRLILHNKTNLVLFESSFNTPYDTKRTCKCKHNTMVQKKKG